ncbi:uncharacterized protein LACBIDRAFT_329738 [Laccaria bicolor S238N-H82]|uniref:Predicted protein n=1 Tax=Laccaria bicolor (strain S238N-H82 / ATCC MYA-4686) TaxID=486041 RepID=B0DJ28_LACBS|nr:uncharacterized protein LACBIDRAFT_329738 [Laccaria bicolor S238N-H82]EDR05450.1 predicted protein [Laccaria bicolor S238N-H82]|eukprot:XP_001884008.1 predicted protein [Laccaria bicolor S238N-H82]
MAITRKRKGPDKEPPSAVNAALPPDVPGQRRKRQKKGQGLDNAKKSQAPVPLPNIDELNPAVGRRRAENRSSESQEKAVIASAERSANLWLKYAPTYTLSHVAFTELMERTKNCDEDVDQANTIISGMQDLEADACSAKFVDKTGKTLACVFSHRTETNDQATAERKGRGETTLYPGPHKRTLKDVQASESEDQRWDGIPNDPMTHSRDMAGRGTCKGQMAVSRYFQGSRSVALYLSECFKVAFPNYYFQYQAAFEAGAWTTEDPGPWLGRAIVWKLPVETHVDGLDDGPTAIFNCGRYRGGELYLPDLKVKLEYDPGTLVILLSGQLYHRVGEWEPGSHTQEDDVTPGRQSNYKIKNQGLHIGNGDVPLSYLHCPSRHLISVTQLFTTLYTATNLFMATHPTAYPRQKLVDPENTEKRILSSHRQNIATGRANAAAKASDAIAAALSASDASQPPTSREPSTVGNVIDVIDGDQAHEEESAPDSAARPSKKSATRKRKRAESKAIEDADATDVNGVYKDVDIGKNPKSKFQGSRVISDNMTNCSVVAL